MSNLQLIRNDYIKRDLLQRQTYHGSSAWKDLGMVPSNCLTVRKDLGDMLQSNEVGIDVEVRLQFLFFFFPHCSGADNNNSGQVPHSLLPRTGLSTQIPPGRPENSSGSIYWLRPFDQRISSVSFRTMSRSSYHWKSRQYGRLYRRTRVPRSRYIAPLLGILQRRIKPRSVIGR